MSGTTYDAVEALEDNVHYEDGWLSDAQDARLSVNAGTVHFCGEGSIDLEHLVEIVVRALEEN